MIVIRLAVGCCNVGGGRVGREAALREGHEPHRAPRESDLVTRYASPYDEVGHDDLVTAR